MILSYEHLVVSDYRSLGGDVEREWVHEHEMFDSFKDLSDRMDVLTSQGVTRFEVDV